MAAQIIQREYYYDESAGIPTVLEKCFRSANSKLRGREGRGLNPGTIGIAVAVIRGSELYVATVGAAEAYLVRATRLLVPEHTSAPGMPAGDLRMDVWRGGLFVGDSIVLISRRLLETVGTEELKDAVLRMHPQSAVEHLHHLFVASGGQGSDALLIVGSEASPRATIEALTPDQLEEPERSQQHANETLEAEPGADPRRSDGIRAQPTPPYVSQRAARKEEEGARAAHGDYDFDVALSYAGEDLEYVGRLADELNRLGMRVFFAPALQSSLWGKDLYVYLDQVFRVAARFCILFISEYSVRKVWTRRESASAFARALNTPDYVLPVRFDDTLVPGLLPTIAYLDARLLPAEGVAQLFVDKVAAIE